MNLHPLEIRLSKSSSLIQSNGLRKSIRQTPAIIKVMFKLIIRRQRYTMQLLKYFVMFPNQSQASEDLSIDSYDRLFFSDDAIHSMVKIYQVKELQNLIWAFLNLKALKYLSSCKQLTKTVQKFYQKRLPEIKNEAFQTIKQYDLLIQSQKAKRPIRIIDTSKYRDNQMNTLHRHNLKLQSNTNDLVVQNQANDFTYDQGIHSKIDIKISNNGQIKQNQINLGDSLQKIATSDSNKHHNMQKKEVKQQQINRVLTKVVFTYCNMQRQGQKNKINRGSSSSTYRYSVPKCQYQSSICQKCCSCCSCGRTD